MLLQTANVLFLDAPVGAGFSYATTSEAWNASDTKLAAQAYQFLRNVSLIDDIYIYIYIKSIKMLIGNFKLDLIALLAPSSEA